MPEQTISFVAIEVKGFNELPEAVKKYVNRYFVEQEINGVPNYVALVTSQFDEHFHPKVPGIAPFIPGNNFDYADDVVGLFPASTIHAWLKMKAEDPLCTQVTQFGRSFNFGKKRKENH